MVGVHHNWVCHWALPVTVFSVRSSNSRYNRAASSTFRSGSRRVLTVPGTGALLKTTTTHSPLFIVFRQNCRVDPDSKPEPAQPHSQHRFNDTISFPAAA